MRATRLETISIGYIFNGVGDAVGSDIWILTKHSNGFIFLTLINNLSGYLALHAIAELQTENREREWEKTINNRSNLKELINI